MGVTGEQRLRQFYERMTWIRRALDVFKYYIPSNGSWEHTHRLVDQWSSEFDMLSGLLLEQSDNCSMFWFLGEPGESFRNMMGDPHYLPSEDDFDWGSLMTPIEEAMEEYAFRTAAENFCDKDIRESCVLLGAWWDVWQQVPATLYPVNRYNDSLFKPFGDRFRKLLGSMVNNRLYACTEQCYVYPSHDNYNQLKAFEQEFLCRRSLVDVISGRYAFTKTLPPRFEACIEKVQASGHPRAAFAVAAIARQQPDYMDFLDVVSKVRAMTTDEVAEALKKHEREIRDKG